MEYALLFAPELVCLIVGLVLFFAVVLGWSYSTSRGIAMVFGIVMVAACLWTLPLQGEPFFPGIYAVDFFSQLLKTALAVGFLFVAVASAEPLTVDRSGWGEMPLFLVCSTLGMMMMVSATELLTLYVAMELTAYPVYIAVALHRNVDTGGESATKYMVQGMAASAISLYGMSFLFGAFGSTYLADISLSQATSQPIFYLGLFLTLAGFFFKLGAFSLPLLGTRHVPNRAPSRDCVHRHGFQNRRHRHLVPLVVAGNARRLGSCPCTNRADVGECHCDELGQFGRARTKRDLKRLLGYSTVAHAGYVLLALQTFAESGLTAALFYALGYFAMSFACFLVICEVGRSEDRIPINAVSGLYKRAPFLCFTLLIGLFGLIGLPPTVGFVGKWFLFSAALQRGQFYLVLVAAINATVAMYYYLLIIRQLYWAEPATQETIKPTPLVALTALATIIIAVAMGTLPGPFWDMAARAARALIG